jgi:aryl-alcohol dehydrogenase-like predicted oxidoreductase
VIVTSVYLRDDNYAKVQQIRRTLQQIAADNHKTMVDLAIAWVLRQPAVTGAIMGIRNAGEARTMLGGLNWQLTPQELETIEAALKIWPD